MSCAPPLALALRTIELEPVAEASGCKLPSAVARHPQRFRDRSSEKRIAERVEDKRERALGDLVFFVADAQLSDEPADRFEDRVERVAVAREDHPRGKRAGPFAVEHVERAIDDVARVRLA